MNAEIFSFHRQKWGLIMFIKEDESDILQEHATSTFRTDGNGSKITMK